ncbi:MAG: DEAD/DEAH box helicase [Silvibacterium sp.]|nr:DEAD/DEAH box helicase [Silvibacterium sp.]
MSTLQLKPTHAPVKAYYETLTTFGRLHFDNEGNIRRSFEALLEKCAGQFKWTVIPEYQFKRKGQHPLRIDAAILDAFNLPRGYWEAKDTRDDLELEMRKKFEAGYPRTNILFQQPARAILFQNGRIEFNNSIEDPASLVDLLQQFFGWRERHLDDWDRAVTEFSERIPDIAQGAIKLIEAERKTNKVFIERFAAFAEVCRESINPDLTDQVIEEMLVQHLLTERIFRRIFDNPEFSRRNVIAAEIEKVIDSLTSRHFSRDAFLKPLDRFYKAIEEAAAEISEYSEKQKFLNNVYEKFFQNFDRRQADTHGIVYTPQSIVDFMVRSVGEILKHEFGRSLSDEGVHILDPFVGTGNFITRIMQEIKTTRLPQKYRNELHCNEVMLLPYYIASMNIEHAYLERAGQYEPFEGICLVDTFEVKRQTGAFAEENARRIARQNKKEVFVVIGNPPYNAWQSNEDENNKKRKYPILDQLIVDSYVKPSKATNKNALWDMYVRAFRWASDRIGEEGVVAFVTNNGFLEGLAFDGMRISLAATFSEIYHFDLKGNARTSGIRRQQEGGNIFNDAIRVGIGITFLVKRRVENKAPARIHLFRVGDYLRRAAKEEILEDHGSLSKVIWQEFQPERGADWFPDENGDFGSFSRIGCDRNDERGIFALYSNGIKSNRDAWVYNFDSAALITNVKRTLNFYNSEVDRWRNEGSEDVDGFVRYESEFISWSRDLKQDLASGKRLSFDPAQVVTATYRPYSKTKLYFDATLNEEVYTLPKIWGMEVTNRAISLTGPGSEKPFLVLGTDCLSDMHVVGAASTGQCFPFYTYDEDGSNRRENITDWALGEFRSHYGDHTITKWDIFHYTYALLHHPEYRSRYAANLKRELPRIPLAPEFHRYAEIGQRLMDIHINYEQQTEYPLEHVENPGEKLDWRVEKMSLSKDRTELRYNRFLTLRGIPPEAHGYKLGNRSALEWIMDQYRVSTDTRSGIVNDPNREDDPEYIVRLIGQVITVSLETQQIIASLPSLNLGA